MALDKIMQWRGEQLFLLEVFVNRLDLHPNKVAYLSPTNLLIQIKVIDLAPFDINPYNCTKIKNGNALNDKENYKPAANSILVNAGKSCLFSKLPTSLVNIMKILPLIIQVYKISVREFNCLAQYNQTLLFSTKVPLPECLCHQVDLTSLDSDELPVPSTAKKVYNLCDPRGKRSASISIFLRLSCVGRSIMTDFSLQEGNFVFHDLPMGEKFQYHKMFNNNIQVNRAIKNSVPYIATHDKKCKGISPRMLMLATTTSKLPILKQDPTDAYQILKRPESPPRISMKEPNFRVLTSAEKLNDREYRNQVYRAYPNEPTCPCLPKYQLTNPMVCASGCNRPCCMKLRNPNILKKRFKANANKKTVLSTYCTNKLHPKFPCTEITKNSCCDVMRLRGGGSIEEIYRPGQSSFSNYKTHTSQTIQEKLKMQRLFAGGEGNASCVCSSSVPVSFRPDQDMTQISSCKPHPKSLNAAQASCVCAGKQTQLFRKGNATCSKAPCMGVDCLIRAFQEAQDFVDSLGKVPGMEGLGLTNPTDSPFFGRNMTKNYEEYLMDALTDQQKKLAVGEMIHRNCTAKCNTLLGKPPAFEGNDGLIPYSSMTPLSEALSKNMGVVREAIPTLPRVGTIISSMRPKVRDDAKHKEEVGHAPLDIELGPCGEPTCRSRLKKSPHSELTETPKETEVAVVESKAKETTVRTDIHRGKTGSSRLNDIYISERKRRKGSSKKKGNIKEEGSAEYAERGGKITSGLSWPGPDGDRIQSPIKISPQVKRYVHTLGNYYPGVNFGHQDCMAIRMRVPKNMGWLWNTRDVVGKAMPGLGWKPGAIQRDAYVVLKEAKAISLENMGYDEESSMRIPLSKSRSQTSESAKTRRGGTRGGGRQAGGGEDMRQETKSVSQNRLKGGGTRPYGQDSDKQVASKSLRSEDTRAKLSSNIRGRKGKAQITGSTASMKKSLKIKDESDEEEAELPPTLHIHRKDGVYYVTMYPVRQETSDTPQLEEPMKPLQFKIVKNKDEDSDSSSSTASDLEIEFSPPAAVNRTRKKPNVVHVGTQVRHREILEALESALGHKRDKKGGKKKKGSRK